MAVLRHANLSDVDATMPTWHELHSAPAKVVMVASMRRPWNGSKQMMDQMMMMMMMRMMMTDDL